ncbi:MAG: hypothetical protein B6242_13365 [Anaerolineaceae bacterium 4572_78]|nr:MAG: hypothetical protein B6242_13365 [Anaerolineaceae bacterium 4572_78]
MKHTCLVIIILLLSLTACNQTTAVPTDSVDVQPLVKETPPTSAPDILDTPMSAPPTSTNTPVPTLTSTSTPEPIPTSIPAPRHQVEMILIPAGSFTIGSNDGQPENGPPFITDLPAFEIDKFEVTNHAFALFVEDIGHVTEAEKIGIGKTWQDYSQDRENHPVVKVTWLDAVAFCEWADKRLPTEAEWEKAARGTDQRIYPWGNEFDATRTNGKSAGLRDTAPVGSFPNGVSPYGVHDMAGNVWEWTVAWYQGYPNTTADNQYFGNQARVTRGGAWFDEPVHLTTFNRNAAVPDITANDDLGFRCVRDILP